MRRQSIRRLLARPTTITIIIAVLLGAGAGQLFARAGSQDQIIVGNTGGTLSSIIRVDDALIIFGGGNARSDLADLLGRSTLPWTRTVDLLIIPGWDNQQALGALGLLERQDVKQIVILGQPSTATIWTVLYQQASSRAIPVNVATRRSNINISPDVRLDLTTGDPRSGESSEYALLTLRFHAVQLDFLDASSDGIKALINSAAMPSRTHALLLTRTSSGFATTATLRVQPAATRGDDIDRPSSDYTSDLEFGQRITINLAPAELRLNLDDIQRTDNATPTEPHP